jgi:hypothetical protein
MGIFDKAENEAENLAQKDPNLAQQEFGGQGGQGDLQAAKNTIGQQGGPQDSIDQNMGGEYQEQNTGSEYQDQNTGSGYQEQNTGGQGIDPNQQTGNQDPTMDQDQQDGYDQNMDPNQGQNQNW